MLDRDSSVESRTRRLVRAASAALVLTLAGVGCSDGGTPKEQNAAEAEHDLIVKSTEKLIDTASLNSPIAALRLHLAPGVTFRDTPTISNV